MGRALKNQIELTREAMVDAAIREGLHSIKTLALSQQLDILLNRLATAEISRGYPEGTDTTGYEKAKKI